jgi:hypothetical protein
MCFYLEGIYHPTRGYKFIHEKIFLQKNKKIFSNSLKRYCAICYRLIELHSIALQSEYKINPPVLRSAYLVFIADYWALFAVANSRHTV